MLFLQTIKQSVLITNNFQHRNFWMAFFI